MQITRTVSLVILALSVFPSEAFVPLNANKIGAHHGKDAVSLYSTKEASSSESEAERLLRKARELRAQAEADEHAIHSELLNKKEKRDAETDSIIDDLFFSSSQSLLDQLRCKRCSADMLIRVVDRLHEREVTAKGLEHVEPSLHHDHTKFERVSQVNHDDLAVVEGLIDQLVEACATLDEEMMAEKKKRGEKYITHTEAEHWHVGECSKVLGDKVREMRREHDDQFQKRLESFYAAQRKKDLPPPDKLNP